MKVGLLGAPGSGKTDIGRRLVRALNKGCVGPNIANPSLPEERWKLIDGYVDELTKRTGRQYGFEGMTPHNIQVMATRGTKEAEALHQGYSTVTCGTVYETMLYEALRWIHPPIGDEQAMMVYLDEGRTTMQFFSMIEAATFNYDLLFFVGTADDLDHTWPGVLNAKIPQILEANFRYAVPLQGKPAQKANHALKAIRHVRDHAAAIEAEAASDQR